MLQTDTQGVWGQVGAQEVHYLVQSQYSAWPNFTGGQVVSPGVASMVLGPGGSWRLFFAGFNPGDRPLISPGVAEDDHRRPYFLGLNVAVPVGQPVSSASDADLAEWITPVLR